MTSGEQLGELFSVHLQGEYKIGFLNYNYFGSELGVNTLVLEHSLVASMQCGNIHSHIPLVSVHTSTNRKVSNIFSTVTVKLSNM